MVSSKCGGQGEVVKAVQDIGSPQNADVSACRRRGSGANLHINMSKMASPVFELDQTSASDIGEGVALKAVEPLKVVCGKRPHETRDAARFVSAHGRDAAAPSGAVTGEPETVPVKAGRPDEPRAWAATLHLRRVKVRTVGKVELRRGCPLFLPCFSLVHCFLFLC